MNRFCDLEYTAAPNLINIAVFQICKLFFCYSIKLSFVVIGIAVMNADGKIYTEVMQLIT